MSNAQEKRVNRIAELKGFRLEGFSVFEAHEPFGQNVWTGPKQSRGPVRRRQRI
jgi:hypothetical protein